MNSEPEFEVGRIYRRRADIHGRFGGQRQGGISTPRGVPAVFLFTSDAGQRYGYEDGFRPDGTFWYTGEGQTGDMTMTGGNRAILEHRTTGKSLHLFEYVGRGLVRYLGRCTYLGHHLEDRRDSAGSLRKAIVFELDLDAIGDEDAPRPTIKAPPSPRSLWRIPLAELRDLALAKASDQLDAVQRRAVTRARSEAVRTYVLRRANGVCEGCRSPAPFLRKDGTPYLEPHHIHRVSDGGPDDPDNVVALCPNCHRRAHYSRDSVAFSRTLSGQLPAKPKAARRATADRPVVES